LIPSAYAQGTLTYQPIPIGPYGSGSSIAVLFKQNSLFPLGSRFNLVLSDASGNFTGSSPRIGTINSHYATYINGLIPANTPASTNYKLRVDVVKPDGSFALSEVIPGLNITIQSANGTNGDANGNFLVPSDLSGLPTLYLRNDSLKYYGYNNCLPSTTTIRLHNKIALDVEYTSKNEFDFTIIVNGPNYATDPAARTGNVTASTNIVFPNTFQRVHYRFFQKVIDPGNSGTISTKAFYFINNQLSAPFSVVSNIICYDIGQPGNFAFKVDIDSTREGSTFFNFPGVTYKADWDDGLNTEEFSVQEIVSKSGLLYHNYNRSSCGETVDRGEGQITYNSFGPSMTATHVSGCTAPAVQVITPIQIFQKPDVRFTSPDKACLGATVNFTNTSQLGLQGKTNAPGCTAPNFTYEWYVGSTLVHTGTNYSTNSLPVGTHTITLQPVVPQNVVLSCTPSDFSRTICIESPPTNTAKFALISDDNTRYQDTSFCPSNNPFAVINQSGTLTAGNYCSALEYRWRLTNASNSLIANKTGSNSDPNFTVPTLSTPAEYTLTLQIINPCGNSTVYTRKITVLQAPVINTQPTDRSVCENNNTSITIGASGSGLTYVWKVSTDGGATFNIVTNGGIYSGATTNQLNITGAILSMNGYKYKVDIAGSCPSPLTSNIVTLTVFPIPIVSDIINQTICAGNATTAISFSSTVNGTTYSWTNSNTAIGLGASGSGNISSFSATNTTNAPITSTITVTPIANGCTGASKTFTIVVNPTPAINTAQSATICSGETFTVSPSADGGNIVPSGTTYSWNAPTVPGITGLAAGTNASSVSGILTNTTSAPINVVYTVTPTSGSCTGTNFTVIVTVNPKPSVTTTQAQTICSGLSFTITPANGGGNNIPSGTTYTWNGPTVSGITGLAAGTNASSISGTLTNTTNAPINVVYSVTPKSGNCNGAPFDVTITVNPTPSANTVSNKVVCVGDQLASIAFSGSVSGTIFTWTNNNTAIGIGASGTGDINTFTVANTTNAVITSTITVTPTANACPGPSTTFTITVNPKPVVQNKSRTICSGGSFSITPTNGTDLVPSGTTYSWSAPIVTGITGAQSGTNESAISGTLTNSTSAPINVVYTVTPVSGSCAGLTFDVIVTVNPTPIVNTISNQTLCVGDQVSTITFAGSVTGTTYSWTNNNISIGLGANGNGNINAFNTTNTTNTPQVATIIVTPTANSCPGPSKTFTITVNPKPIVQSKSQTICSGGTFSVIPVHGTDLIPSGTTYSWSAPSVTGISGTQAATNASSISGTLVNSTNATIEVVYTVTPSYTNNGILCSGQSFTVTITVMPRPIVANEQTTVCSGMVFSITPADGNGNGNVVPVGTTYSWSAPAVDGITGTLAGSNASSISGRLTNTTSAPINVAYTVTPSFGSCSGTPFTVTVTVNPKPTLSAALLAPICSGTNFSYIPSSGVSGTSFSWSRAAINGISNVAASGIGNISEVLTNTTSDPINVVYVYQLTANGCSNTENVTVTVNPVPAYTGVLSPTSVCSNKPFTYAPASSTANASFIWTRNVVAGISNPAVTNGTGSINETLINTTTSPIDVTYTYTVSANGCTNPNTYSFVVKVFPQPRLTSSLTPADICTGSTFGYAPTSSVTGTGFVWTRAAISGINNNTSGGGSDAISETLANSTTQRIKVIYTYTLTANGCSYQEDVLIWVNPTPVISSTLTPASICSGNTFSYTAMSATLGTTFSWTRNAINGINNAATTQNSASINEVLVNATPNPIDVVYTITLSANACNNTQTITVRVNPIPELTSSLSPDAICSSESFIDNPTSATPGATFSWSRPAVTGISNAARTDISGSVFENLTNITTAPIDVTYIYTISANGCSKTQNVVVRVNPKPTLTSTLTPPAICSGETFLYNATSATSGTTFTWSRSAVSGISNSPATGIGLVSETLINTTANPITVTYVFTLTANGCANVQTVAVVVNPIPVLTSTLNRGSICNNTEFRYTPTSSTLGASFTWTRPVVSGISNAAGSGTGSITEALINTTTDPLDVTYIYAANANGCTNPNSFSVVVRVNPTPRLSTTLTPDPICSNTRFDYTPNSLTSGASFVWTRPSIAGVNNGVSASGTGPISETLINNTPNPIDVLYNYTITANGCSSTQTVTVRLNPIPALNSSLTPAGICSGSSFSYAPTSLTPGVVFGWTRALLSGISNSSATGSGNINEVLVNTTAEPINVTYILTLSANGCTNTQNVVVRVSPISELTSSLNPTAICSETQFSYTPTSATTGAQFTWTRALITGISNAAVSGAGSVNEILTNTTASPIDVTYVYTVRANGCEKIQSVVVRVNPKPLLSSTLSPNAICSNTTFNYTATSATAGVGFTWSRAAIGGISNAAATGGSIINETLVNTTPNPINVTYTLTLTANGCTNTQNVVVRINPRPLLTTPLVLQPQCSGTLFTYVPSSATAGTTFSWQRNSIAGISNAPANGTGAINEVLNNTTGNPITVVYMYTLEANGCTFSQNISVIIDPLPLADFTRGILVSCGPLTKSFENTSTVNGNPLTNGSFRWDIYKQGITNPILTLASVTYYDRLDFRFTNSGIVDSVYEVVLTAISPNGCVNTTRQQFTIHPDARAYFEVLNISACSPFDVMANNNVAATAYTFANNQTTYRWTIMDKNRQVIRAVTSFTPPAHVMINDNDTNYIKLDVDSRWGCLSSSNERMVRTHENPTVDFSFNVTEGCTPLSTTVTNNSYLGPSRNVSTLKYSWLLNGAFASSNRNDILALRNNSFTTDSLVNIKLVVSENINGCKDSLVVGPVTVFPKPSPKFLILKNDPECAQFGGIERSVDDLSIYKFSPNRNTRYMWSAQYSNGTNARSVGIDSSNIVKPVFAFPDNKSFFDTVYSLKLKLISVDGCEDSTVNTIKLFKRPNIQFTLPIDTGCGSNNIVPLDFTNNFREDSLIRNWTVVPSDGVIISDAAVRNPEIIFPVNNTDNVIVYTVRQSVKSIVGCEDVLSRIFSVYPLPDAKFTSGNADKRDSCGPWTKTFHNESDPKNGASLNDRTVLFKWTIIKDGKQIFATANETTRFRLTYTFTNTGVVDSLYTVKLWIQNIHGCVDSLLTNYTVRPNPKAFFDGDTTGCAPFNLRDNLKVKDFPFANDLYGYEWRIYDRFGFLIARRDSIDVPDYTMMDEGDTIRLQLIAKSPYGCKTDIFDRVIVTRPKSVKADFDISADSFCSDAKVKLTNKSYLSVAGQTDGLTYKWLLNGSLIGTNKDTTLVLPNLSYVKDTTYNIKLFASFNDLGCTDSIPDSVIVRPRPKVMLSVSGTDTCGSPVGVTKEINDLSLVKPGALLKTWSLVNENTGKSLGLPFPVNGSSNAYQLKFGDNKGAADSIYTLGLRLKSVDGCISDTTYKIVLYRRPDVKFSFNKPEVCGQEIVLVQDSTKNVEHTKRWSYETFQGDPIQIITPASINPSIVTASNTSSDKVYYFIKQVATTVNGCMDSATATLTARPIPIAKFKPETDTSCTGQLYAKFIDLSYTQTPGAPIKNWSWKFDDGSIDTLLRNPSHKFETPGRFNVSLVVRDDQGCASDPFFSPITVYGAPTASFVLPQSDVHCIIDTLKPWPRTVFGFGSTKVTSYKWDFGDPAQDFNELGKEFPRHIYTKPGVYRVKLSVTTDSSCVVASYEDSVYIVGKPEAGFYTVNSCVGVPVNFIDTSKAGLYDKIGRYYWDFGDGKTSTDRNPTYIYQKSGTYNVTQIVFGQYCVLQSDTTIPAYKMTVYDKRKDSIYPRLHLPYNTPTVVCADPGNVSYAWSPKGDLDFTNMQCPEVTITMESITYNIRIVDTSGCIMNDKQEIWGFPKNDVFLPRAFIPNNPVMTENKILKPVYVGIKELKSFRVFDRFGHLIFSTNDMAHFWDGTTNNGKLSPTETYSWIIVAIDTQGKQIIKKGNVTLIRN
jgi:gliding motility-associated-like protein